MCLNTQPIPEDNQVTYEPPAIVYEGEVSTRSGSGTGGGAPVIDGEIDLFDDD